MEKLKEAQIQKVQIEIEKESKSIKIGGFASAIASITGVTAVSLCSLPIAAAVGAAGVGLTLKFLFDKFSIEDTEKQFKKFTQDIEISDKMETELNELILKNSDKELLKKVNELLQKGK